MPKSLEKILQFLCFIAVLGMGQAIGQQATIEQLRLVAGSPKLLNPTAVLAPFREGQEHVDILVELAYPKKAVKLSQQTAPSVKQEQTISLPAGTLYFNLKNEDVKSRLRELVRNELTATLSSLDTANISVTRKFTYIFGFSATTNLTGLQQLLEMSQVTSVTEDPVLEAHLAQGIPLIRATLPRTTYKGAGISIATCDTGIDTAHPRLGGGGYPIFNSKVIGGFDTGDIDWDPRPTSSGSAHGTACAGISAGNTGTVGDYIGGVAPSAKLYSLKITAGVTSSASGSALAAAWEWAVTHQNDDPSNPIMIISTSFGGGRHHNTCDAVYPPLTKAAVNAVAAGITVFASSGNEGYCNSIDLPACITNVNSVGAVYDSSFGRYYPCVNANSCAPKTAASGCSTGYYATDATAPDKVTSYSNSAWFLNIFAPSNAAYTTDISGAGGYAAGDYFSSFGGTSAACAYAAGAAASLQSAAKAIRGVYLTPGQVRQFLTIYGDLLTDGKIAVTKPRVNLARSAAKLHPPQPGEISDFPWGLFLPAILGDGK